jgi:tetratricopeptide (TPR) repeat protein
MIIKIIAMGLFLLLLVVVYVGVQGYREYQKALTAKVEGNFAEAVTHYQRSIKWYLPGAPHVSGSAQALWEIGEAAQERGDREMALTAFQELRSSFYAVRSFYTPGKDWIEKCNQKIAVLMAQWETTSSERKEKASLEDLKQKHLDILTKKDRPDYFWSVVLEVGFFGWVGAVVGFIMQVFQGEKGFVVRRALGWGSLFLISYATWIIGMLKA